jgi:carbon storage regulator
MRRRAGETILIDETIEIQVLEICGTRVKLGIVAPDSVLIQRKEIKITREENIAAARGVGQQSISAILDTVAAQSIVAPVKKLTDATALTMERT